MGVRAAVCFSSISILCVSPPTAGGGTRLAAAEPELAGLQVALQQRGLYTGPIDATMGPQTRDALIRFQSSVGLVPDGVVGARTRRALGQLGRPRFGRRTLMRGLSGWDVSVLQYLLATRGLLGATPNGVFGPATEAAVIRFQRARDLVPDGLVGPLTGRRLCGTCPWRLSSSHPAATSVPIPTRLDYWALRYRLDRRLVRALAWQESGYNPAAVSEQGATGVMQLTPDAWTFVVTVVIHHPVPATTDGNIHVGVAYLRYLLSHFSGNIVDAVAAYLQGPRSVEVQGVLPATRVYVDDVLSLTRSQLISAKS